jgi:hypothetical protein
MSDDVPNDSRAERLPAPADEVLDRPPATAVEADSADIATLLMRLQATGGNQAVVRLLASSGGTAGAANPLVLPVADRGSQPKPEPELKPEPKPPQVPLPSSAELAERIAQAIGVWETNRGGTEPKPHESDLQTVAGIPASMATIEQATMPYLVDALRKHKELRDRAEPPLTREEVDAARQRIKAVDALLSSIETAAGAGTSPDAFIKANATKISAAGMSEDNVRTMFDAVTLHTTITAAHGQVEQAAASAKTENPEIKSSEIKKIRSKTVKKEVAEIPEDQRLGVGDRSLAAYISRRDIWGENRAAWERLAVQGMANDVGARIESVARAQHGTAVATMVIRDRVDSQRARKPPPTEEELVIAVARQNNSKEHNYGENVWHTYQRLFPVQPPSAEPASAAPRP